MRYMKLYREFFSFLLHRFIFKPKKVQAEQWKGSSKWAQKLLATWQSHKHFYHLSTGLSVEKSWSIPLHSVLKKNEAVAQLAEWELSSTKSWVRRGGPVSTVGWHGQSHQEAGVFLGTESSLTEGAELLLLTPLECNPRKDTQVLTEICQLVT